MALAIFTAFLSQVTLFQSTVLSLNVFKLNATNFVCSADKSYPKMAVIVSEDLVESQLSLVKT
jgi:hypothetical protein